MLLFGIVREGVRNVSSENLEFRTRTVFSANRRCWRFLAGSTVSRLRRLAEAALQMLRDVVFVFLVGDYVDLSITHIPLLFTLGLFFSV